jgi:hypothetical protein
MFKNIYNYINNVGADIVYGYVEVKCANRNCRRIYKFSRNSLNMNNINNYCCGMGCALESYNQMENEK